MASEFPTAMPQSSIGRLHHPYLFPSCFTNCKNASETEKLLSARASFMHLPLPPALAKPQPPSNSSHLQRVELGSNCVGLDKMINAFWLARDRMTLTDWDDDDLEILVSQVQAGSLGGSSSNTVRKLVLSISEFWTITRYGDLEDHGYLQSNLILESIMVKK